MADKRQGADRKILCNSADVAPRLLIAFPSQSALGYGPQMPVTLNHTIVHAVDAVATATFYADILNLPPPRRLGHFTVLQVGQTSLDMLQTDQPIASRHFAFLVSEAEFDDILGRIIARQLPYWADPFHRISLEINRWDDGRGVYFDDPNGHILEVITRPYGSGGLGAQHPNPLLSS